MRRPVPLAVREVPNPAPPASRGGPYAQLISPLCTCPGRGCWYVTQRLGNRSAFSGYRWTRSDYSQLVCLRCGRTWRTRASYVARVPDAPPGWHNNRPGVEGYVCPAPHGGG